MRCVGCILALLSVGCAESVAPPRRYEPLVCDPAAAEHVAFGVQVADAHFAPTGQRYYGEHFLFVDGSCRWFAGRADVDPVAFVGGVRTGVLDAATLDELNGSLLTGSWERLDADYRAWGGPDAGSDAPTSSLWRDALGARCYGGCPYGWPDFPPMFEAAREWERRLAELGAPFEGPVRLVWSSASSLLAGAHEWTGTTDLGAELDGYGGELVVVDGGDAAVLRGWRAETVGGGAIRLRVGDRSYFVYAIDEIPLADAMGKVRPPF